MFVTEVNFGMSKLSEMLQSIGRIQELKDFVIVNVLQITTASSTHFNGLKYISSLHNFAF